MKINLLFVINSIVAGLFGLAFLLGPQWLMLHYGVTMTAEDAVIGRLFGASLLGYGVLTWTARNAGPSEARKAIVWALFIADAVGCVVSLFAQVGGLVNALGWSTVVIYGLLAIGFGMAAFSKEA